MQERWLTLAGGRRLGWLEVGKADGWPLFYFHGLPGSRLEAEFFHLLAVREQIRIIAPDRPGFGLSAFQPGRTLEDWPRDVAALADHLTLDRFAVLGNSGGGPYALACARFLAERLAGAAVVCGLGPLDSHTGPALCWWPRLVFTIARGPRRLLAIFVRSAVFSIRRFPEQILTAMALKASPRDREVLRDDRVRHILQGSFQEAVRQGAAGGIRELEILSRPWNFRPEEITMPVQLWYGGRDRTVPAAMGRSLAEAIPAARHTVLPEEGHFSVPFQHMAEILRKVKEFSGERGS